MHPNRARLAFDLGLIWFQVAVGAWVYLANPSFLTLLLAWFLIAGAQHALAMVVHEAVHFLLLPAQREWNDRIARWGFAGPILLPYSTYRQRHFEHHRSVSTEDDTKELYRHDLKGWRFLWEGLRSLSGFEFMSTALKVLRGLRATSEKKAQKTQPLVDVQSILVAHLVLLNLFGGWQNYLLLWLFPTITFLQFFGKLRAAVEHRPLEKDAGQGPYYLGTETPLLRSVRATPFERLFLSRLNFHFHAEHHLLPQVSYQYLPLLNERLRKLEGHCVQFERSYGSVLYKLWKGQ